MMKTIFLDIDGVLLPQFPTLLTYEEMDRQITLLPGVFEKFKEWSGKGYHIILTTARKKSRKKTTEKKLTELGLQWDELIMGLPTGRRILVNDLKPDNPEYPMAVAINIERNKGFKDVNFEDSSL